MPPMERVSLCAPALLLELSVLEAASYARLSEKLPRDVRMVVPYRTHQNPLLGATRLGKGEESDPSASLLTENSVDEALLAVLAERRLQLATKYTGVNGRARMKASEALTTLPPSRSTTTSPTATPAKSPAKSPSRKEIDSVAMPPPVNKTPKVTAEVDASKLRPRTASTSSLASRNRLSLSSHPSGTKSNNTTPTSLPSRVRAVSVVSGMSGVAIATPTTRPVSAGAPSSSAASSRPSMMSSSTSTTSTTSTTTTSTTTTPDRRKSLSSRPSLGGRIDYSNVASKVSTVRLPASPAVPSDTPDTTPTEWRSQRPVTAGASTRTSRISLSTTPVTATPLRASTSTSAAPPSATRPPLTNSVRKSLSGGTTEATSPSPSPAAQRRYTKTAELEKVLTPSRIKVAAHAISTTDAPADALLTSAEDVVVTLDIVTSVDEMSEEEVEARAVAKASQDERDRQLALAMVEEAADRRRLANAAIKMEEARVAEDMRIEKDRQDRVRADMAAVEATKKRERDAEITREATRKEAAQLAKTEKENDRLAMAAAAAQRELQQLAELEKKQRDEEALREQERKEVVVVAQRGGDDQHERERQVREAEIRAAAAVSADKLFSAPTPLHVVTAIPTSTPSLASPSPRVSPPDGEDLSKLQSSSWMKTDGLDDKKKELLMEAQRRVLLKRQKAAGVVSETVPDMTTTMSDRQNRVQSRLDELKIKRDVSGMSVGSISAMDTVPASDTSGLSPDAALKHKLEAKLSKAIEEKKRAAAGEAASL